MKTITTNLYSYNELNEEAKKVALAKETEIRIEGQEISELSDNSFLFEPKEEELKKLFGEAYTEPITQNINYQQCYFALDSNWHLKIAEAIMIDDEGAFLTWLGIDKKYHDDFDFFFDDKDEYRNSSTVICFEILDNAKHSEEDLHEQWDIATKKWNEHIEYILNNLRDDWYYRISEECVLEFLDTDECKYLEDGTIF